MGPPPPKNRRGGQNSSQGGAPSGSLCAYPPPVDRLACGKEPSCCRGNEWHGATSSSKGSLPTTFAKLWTCYGKTDRSRTRAHPTNPRRAHGDPGTNQTARRRIHGLFPKEPKKPKTQWPCAGCKAPNWTTRQVTGPPDRSADHARRPFLKSTPTVPHHHHARRVVSARLSLPPPMQQLSKVREHGSQKPRQRENQGGERGSQRENQVTPAGARRPARPTSARLRGPTAKHAGAARRQKKQGRQARLCRSTDSQSKSLPGQQRIGHGRCRQSFGRSQARHVCGHEAQLGTQQEQGRGCGQFLPRRTRGVAASHPRHRSKHDL